MLESSESFAYFKKNGIKPPSQNSWNKVLFELGPETFVRKQLALLGYAQAKGDANLTRAVQGFDPEAAKQVSEIQEDDAEEAYKKLIEEKRTLEGETIPEYKSRIKHHEDEFKKDKDLDHQEYIEETELKIAVATKRIALIDKSLDLLEAVHYIPDETQEERFMVRD